MVETRPRSKQTRPADPARAAPEDKPGSAIAKTFALLGAITRSDQPLALHDLAHAAGIPKPSAHRMLLQLEEIGIVKRDLTGKRFAIGDELATLALGAVGVLARTGTVRDIMQALVAEIGETCNLGVLDGREVLYLERVECEHALRLHLQAGSRVPLHTTAVGKLILAHATAEKCDRLLGDAPLEQLTPKTLTRAGLLAQLPEIRRTGFSMNRQESVLGVIGLGTPVLDDAGNMLAGLAIHAPLARFDEGAVEAAKPALRRAAQKIAGSLTPQAAP
ncbi:MAG: IclR family transcriptional regulator [Pseudomonadota bacterium]